MDIARLKNLREDHDLKQYEMASLLGVSRTTYSLWELGINIIPVNYLVLFANHFAVNMDYLVGLAKEKKQVKSKNALDKKMLGSKLKEVRVKKGLSQENIASDLEVSQACITKYEKGQVLISTNNLCKFAKIYHVSLDFLCGRV